MRVIIFFILCLLSGCVFGQSTMTINPSGAVSVTVENVSGKDPIWNGITLTTSKGVLARSNSSVTFNYAGAVTTYNVTYNKDTKTYYVDLQDGSQFTSTTKAAILAAINAEIYQAITGRQKT